VIELNNSLLLLQIYQSALFAVLSFAMFFRHGDYSKKFLGWFMILSTIYALSNANVVTGTCSLFWYNVPLDIAMLLSFFPLFYYYIKSLIIPGYRFHNRELIHLAPALFLFLFPVAVCFLADGRQSCRMVTSTGMAVHSWYGVVTHVYDMVVYSYFSVQVVIYSTRVAALYRVHKANIEKAFSYTNSIRLYWVFALMMLFLLFLLLLGLSQFLGLDKHALFYDVIRLFKFLIIFIFALFAILQQEIYPHTEETIPKPELEARFFSPGFENGTTDQDTVECTIMEQTDAINETIEPCDEEDCCRIKKYAGSGLSVQQKKALGRKLDKLMAEKLYLHEKLTIDDVAERLGTNSKYLSQVINELQQQNFYTYINAFRIRYAENLLREKQHQKFSIHGIARMAGFSSKSTFNEAFRRITGMTPSEYLEKGNEMVK
jgi:AraC-like DNA-binding protein